MKNLALQTFKVRNFKAVKDSKTLRFTPLTVFIGNNGSGKSSIIEGLATYQMILKDGLEEAMNYWRGFEHICNKAVPHPLGLDKINRSYLKNPVEFYVRGRDYQTEIKFTTAPNGDLFILEEKLKKTENFYLERNSNGSLNLIQLDKNLNNGQTTPNCQKLFSEKYEDDNSLLHDVPKEISHHFPNILEDVLRWQFVNLNPASMGTPSPQRRVAKRVKLNQDGSNLADYLLDIYEQDQSAFDGILETMQYVLPYARDIQPTLTSRLELEPKIYLQLTEKTFKVPGWLFSTGTLRVMALLALFRHPNPPPLIAIEEIENGLDPRTIHLIVEEIKNVVESGKTQLILTTHSPYLLDLLDLAHIVLVERDASGQPVFVRPSDQKYLNRWAEDFSPGKLYTMGRLGQEG